VRSTIELVVTRHALDRLNDISRFETSSRLSIDTEVGVFHLRRTVDRTDVWMRQIEGGFLVGMRRNSRRRQLRRSPWTAEELEIRTGRGHDGPGYSDGWMQCKWCGVGRRSAIEDREDETPKAELNIGVRTDRKLDRMRRDMERTTALQQKKPRNKK
jgi:hypothetical protein